MKHGLSHTLALVSVGFTALAVTPIHAQTTAPGPYYATPSWDQTLPSNTRFIVLSNMNSEAVLDRETGLVWQRTASESHTDWFFGLGVNCGASRTGDRMGWRMPQVHELLSLIAPRTPDGTPMLPPGHPFIINPDSGGRFRFWTANTDVQNATFAYVVDLDNPFGSSAQFKEVNNFVRAWCIRAGGDGVNPR